MTTQAAPLNGEVLISLAEAAGRFPGQRGATRLHPATLTCWILRGVKGPNGSRVKLEAVRAGSRWLTSDAALARFITALTPAPDSPIEVGRTPAARTRAAEHTAMELKALGC